MREKVINKTRITDSNMILSFNRLLKMGEKERNGWISIIEKMCNCKIVLLYNGNNKTNIEIY